jgi:hypothetical protein
VIAILGCSVTGNVAPEKVKPGPVILAALTVTGVVPVELSLSGCVKAVPTGSLPKFRLLLLKVRTGSIPVPLRFTVSVLPVAALLDIVIFPLAVPAVFGSKLTCRTRVFPGLSVLGSVYPAME